MFELTADHLARAGDQLDDTFALLEELGYAAFELGSDGELIPVTTSRDGGFWFILREKAAYPTESSDQKLKGIEMSERDHTVRLRVSKAPVETAVWQTAGPSERGGPNQTQSLMSCDPSLKPFTVCGGGNRVQRAALLPSKCFSLCAWYFPVDGDPVVVRGPQRAHSSRGYASIFENSQAPSASRIAASPARTAKSVAAPKAKPPLSAPRRPSTP